MPGLEHYIHPCSNQESDDVAETPPSGPFGHKDFRMIDASTCDLRDPTDRNRKDSVGWLTVTMMCPLMN